MDIKNYIQASIETKTKILKSDLDTNKYFSTIDHENEKEKYENIYNYLIG